MPLRYVLDEHFRRILWNAIQRHNAGGVNLLDAVRVGDPADLPLGTKDPDLFVWAEHEGRVLVTRDQHTMTGHLAAHLAAGRHSPGVLILNTGFPLSQLVFYLALAAYIFDPADVRDQFRYLP